MTFIFDPWGGSVSVTEGSNSIMEPRLKKLWAVIVLAGVVATPVLAGEAVSHARLDRLVDEYDVHQDLSYTRVVSQDITLFTPRALRQLDRVAWTFYPDKQTAELVEAWVEQPDGVRIPVAKGSVFTRPSAASQSAPGFVNSLTTTVLFPQLVPGSRTHAVWRITQNTPELLGFNAYNMNDFNWDTVSDETRITLPEGVPFHWGARGGFAVEDQVTGGVRRIVARVQNTRAREAEPSMTSASDFMPVFAGTSLVRLEDVGAVIWRASVGRAAPTPEIVALAARVAGEKTGLDAARSIHAWVADNIRYVAVYLNPNDGWVPHSAADVLKAGYGDCKEYVVLMQALLAARGIEAQMAAIDWGNRYADLPVGSPYFANHAILYLPAFDRFVNPTNRNAGFDSLDRRLSGKRVVIMTPEGRVSRTPPSTLEANRYRYSAQTTLAMNGSIDGAAQFTMGPNAEIPARSSVAEATSLTDLAQRLLGRTPEGGFGAFQASDPRNLLLPLALSATWHSPMAVNAQGREVFLRVPQGPDLYPPEQQRAKLLPAGGRTTPTLADVTDEAWQTRIALPPGLAVLRLPPDVDLETSVGRYTAQYRQDQGGIVVTRNLVIGQQVVAPEAYPELERLLYAPMVDARAVIALTPVTD